jgi:diguanylate cyclase (GGDEF)-like protein/PAS domain S-box-containing protein
MVGEGGGSDGGRQSSNVLGGLVIAADDLVSLIELDADAIVLTDGEGVIAYVNPGFTRLFGYTFEEMRGRPVGETLPGPHTDTTTLQRVLNRASSGESRPSESVLLYPKQGRPVWALLKATRVYDAPGSQRFMMVVLTDFTRDKLYGQLQHAMLEAMARERPVTDVMTLLCIEVERIAPEIVATVVGVDAQNRLHALASPSLPESYVEGVNGLAIGPDVASCGTAAWRGEPVVALDISTDPRWKDFQHLVLPMGLRACWSNPIKTGDGRVLGAFAFYYREPRGPDDFHRSLVEACLGLAALALEREEARLRLHRLAYTDTLTGLLSREAFKEEASHLLAEALREKSPVAVLFIDLDRFKLINDAHGHTTGDDVLRETAQRLIVEARAVDLLTRWGGDEFAMLLPQCGTAQALQAAERLLRALGSPIHLDARSLAVKSEVSIGVALYPNDGENIDTLLRHAEMAMSKAKSEGRNSAQFFNREMDVRAQELAAFTAALRAGQLRLHYQPKVGLDGDVLGVEALARWTHPAWGSIPPDRFIALAEEGGLMGEVSRWALNEACCQLAQWRADGVDVPNVAINVSAPNFRSGDLAAYILETLRRHDLGAADITLEMTEGAMFDSAPGTMERLQAVRNLGVRLSVDDFGTGYSSLGYLHRMPIDELKIDKSFVRDLDINPVSQALTNTVLGIGQSLGLTVVAEGVETESQRAFLAQRGCQALQGYLFTRPLPPDELAHWIRDRGAM